METMLSMNVIEQQQQQDDTYQTYSWTKSSMQRANKKYRESEHGRKKLKEIQHLYYLRKKQQKLDEHLAKNTIL